MADALTLEETFRLYGAWAGIHDFDFDRTVDAVSQSITGVEPDTWQVYPCATGLLPNFSVQYHKTSYRQGILISSPDLSSYYLLATDSSGYMAIMRSTDFTAQYVPVATPEEADVEVTYQQQALDDTGTQMWRTITVYMNGAWVTSFNDLALVTSSPMSIGFAVYDTDVVHYTNILVPELAELVEFGTLDPGENDMNGLQRTIDGRYLKFFARWDGSLRAWRKKQRDQVMTFVNSQLQTQQVSDLSQLITHARMMGAYIWAEYADKTLVVQYGHRFQEVDNSMLLTDVECQIEAFNTVRRSQEASFTFSFEAQHVPILEPEDRITVNGTDWVINDYTVQSAAGRLNCTYNCRLYVWG